MTEGAFKGFRHEHYFKSTEIGARMTDRFDYESPLGIMGRFADFIVLKRYMTKLLITRNETIRILLNLINGSWFCEQYYIKK